MLELDERTRRDLDDLRTQQAPSAAAKQRMYAALELRLGPGPGSEGGDLDGEPPTGSGELGLASSKAGLAYAAKVVGATLALTVVGLVSLRGAVLGARALGEQPSKEHASPREPAAEPAPPQPEPRPAAEPITARTETETQTQTQTPAPRPRERQPAASKAPAEPVDSLAAEMALLEQANGAGEPGSKLTHLDRHADRFPHGQLADEREILRIEALCDLGQLDRAGALARSFLAERPNSPVRARVRGACPELALEQEK